MKGICCICREKIGAERMASGRVVASFRLQHYGLCPTCQGRTQADIARVYGPPAAAPVGATSGVTRGRGKGSRL